MARLHRRAEEVRELREARARHAPGEQPPRERDRVDDGRGEPRPGQPLGLAVEEREVEARVVRDEHRVAGEARGTAAPRPAACGAPRSCRSVSPVSAVIVGPSGTPRIDERLELVDELEADDAHRADLADLRRARPQAGRLEVDDDERRVLEQQVGAERPRERDRVAAPREPRVRLDDLGEQRAREPDRRLRGARRAGAPPPRRRPARAAPRRAPRAGRRRRASAACPIA